MIIMKNLFIAAGAFLLLPFPLQAGQILPNLYAQVYCESMALGMTADQARIQAVAESYISSGNPRTVTIQGTTTTTDIVAAARTAMKQCPQYF